MNTDSTLIEQIIAREPDEPLLAYTAFLTFAGLPPNERSNFASVTPKLSAVTDRKKEQIRLWSKTYKWDERVGKLETYLFGLQVRDRAEAMRLNNQEYIEENRKFVRRAQNVAQMAVEAAEELLKIALTREAVETGHVTTEDGKVVPTVVQFNMKAKVSDIGSLMRAAAQVQRSVAGLPTEMSELESNKPVDLSDMSDEEIEAALNKIRSEKTSISAAMKIDGIQ